MPRRDHLAGYIGLRDAGRRGVYVPALNAFSLVASIMNTQCAIQFGVTHF